MNPQLLSYFATSKLTDFGWVILLFAANDFLEKDPIISYICVVGAILVALLGIWHKSANTPSVTSSVTTVKSTETEEVKTPTL